MQITQQYQSRSQSMPVRGLGVGIALAKRIFPVRFRTVDACSLMIFIKSQSTFNAGPQSNIFHRNLFKSYTRQGVLRKLRTFFTKKIYLFDFVSMEQLKGAIEGALTKRNLSIALKKEQMECVSSILDGRDVLAVLPTGYGRSLIFQLLPDIYDQLLVVCAGSISA